MTNPPDIELFTINMAVGAFHVCQWWEGELSCWGKNESGQLGNGKSGVGQLETTPV